MSFLLWELGAQKQGWQFTGRYSNTGVVVKHWQKEQRLLVKKRTLKWIMFEINTQVPVSFQNASGL